MNICQANTSVTLIFITPPKVGGEHGEKRCATYADCRLADWQIIYRVTITFTDI